MMLGNPEFSGEKMGNEAGGSSAAAAAGPERSFSAAGSRWPQEETSALLKIRLEMDSAFRDAVVKSHLWDEVSRRMAEMGYHRSGKKCKEKFENLYKYHRRTKKDQLARSNGKMYRFFDQLEALDQNELSPISPASDQAMAMDAIAANPANPTHQALMSSSFQNFSSSAFPAPLSATSSSGEEYEGKWKRKRKWEEFFGGIMKVVLDKQEDLHKKFLEALDRCESERIAREEAWKTREMDRIKREQELLEQERAIAAAKDAAVIAFLQKVTEQGKNSAEAPDNNENQWENSAHSGSSRWPKEEVEALIKIRANMELDSQGNGTKSPMWEEISAAMKKLGYERNAKRCKEKWENINKYFRRVKESNKRRPGDSRTCPYFQQLEALYTVKSRRTDTNANANSDANLRPEELLMHMMNHNHNREQEQEQEQQDGSMGHEGAIQSVGQAPNERGDEDEGYEEGGFRFAGNDPSSRFIVG